MTIKRVHMACRFKRIFWCSICLAICGLATAHLPAAENAHFGVLLVETDAEDCLAHGGKLVSLQRTTNTNHSIEVWIDRWFMQVQTADHTRHVLNSKTPEVALGCTHSLAGPQHWTIFSTRVLQPAHVSTD